MSLAIQEVAEKIGLSIHTLRYYEDAGLIPSVNRADNGHRRYSDLDLRWLYFVRRLRATGMPTSEIRRYTSLALQGDSTLGERLTLLEAHRDKVQLQIEELTLCLNILEAKIAGYQALHSGLNGQGVPDCKPEQ